MENHELLIDSISNSVQFGKTTNTNLIPEPVSNLEIPKHQTI